MSRLDQHSTHVLHFHYREPMTISPSCFSPIPPALDTLPAHRKTIKHAPSSPSRIPSQPQHFPKNDLPPVLRRQINQTPVPLPAAACAPPALAPSSGPPFRAASPSCLLPCALPFVPPSPPPPSPPPSPSPFTLNPQPSTCATLALSVHALVTGAAGFIGSHLVDDLLARGARVTLLDNLSSGSWSHVDASRHHPHVHTIEGDVRDAATVADAARGCDTIFHLAAIVGVRRVVQDPITCIRTSTEGTQHVLDAAWQSGARVVLASSSEVYGRSAAVPFREDGERLLGPTTVSRWAYATAKALDEHLALAYACRGLPVVVLRYFNVFGPRLDAQGYGGVVARFLKAALAGSPLTVHGDGTQTRSFTYVADAARATALAGEEPAAQGHVINVGSPRETSVLDLARLVLEVTDSASPIEHLGYAEAFGPGFEDPPRRLPAVEKARDLLGFEPTTTLEQGLRLTLTWLQSQPPPQQERPDENAVPLPPSPPSRSPSPSPLHPQP